MVTKTFHYLYKITNKINNHFYIGRRTFKGECINDDTYFGSGKRLKLAIRKYGKDNFIKEIISLHDSFEDLVQAEIDMVDQKLIEDINCYNLALGGNGGYTYYAERIYVVSEETKQRISIGNTGNVRNDVKTRNIESGFNKFWQGKSRSEEDRKNKSIAAKNSKTNKFKTMIICPHCNKEGNVPNMKRWHFENCRNKR